MGIVNITPDSFSDGGLALDAGAAVAQAEQLNSEGADIIDFGAESTRPGARPISIDEEWFRLEPVLRRLMGLSKRSFKISLDSRNERTVLRALEWNIDIVNNVAGLYSQSVLKAIADASVGYVAMHSHGNPQIMQAQPLRGIQAVEAVDAFFSHSFQKLKDAGIKDEKIYLDPGIGFGKDDTANLRVLARTCDWVKKYQLLIGISRKSWIGRQMHIEKPIDRDPASKGIELGLMIAGVAAIRTHQVGVLGRLREMAFGSQDE